MWKPRHLTALWASTACYRDSFTFSYLVTIYVIVLIPRSWVLEKPPVAQLLKSFPKCYGNREFITVFTRALHRSLSWARWIQSIQPRPICMKWILLSFHLLHCLPSGLFPSGSPTKILYTFLFPMLATFPAHLIPLYLIIHNVSVRTTFQMYH
jgi:hypothetical protein